MRIAAAACVVLGAVPSFAGLVVAEGGAARVRIVVAADAIPAERTAARELADYLRRATGAPFEVGFAEGEVRGPAIFVGHDPEAGAEEWRIRTTPAGLVLAGGRPRGTLYAVYRFLEDVVGVRWWTPHDESVPQLPALELPEIDRSGRPAFGYRDLHGLVGPPVFSARNRHNGDRSWLGVDHGGRQAYGPPGEAHSFWSYLPPQELFAAHPEYFSEIDGRRTDDRAQICLTNPDVRALVTARLIDNIERSQAAAAAAGEVAASFSAVAK